MNKLIREFNEPTDIVISGKYYETVDASLAITDDEHSYWIQDGEARSLKNSSGYVFIFSKEEYEKVQHEEDEEGFEVTFINGFKGKIELRLIDYKEKTDCDTSDFDLHEYVMFQTPEDFDWGDVIVVLNRD